MTRAQEIVANQKRLNAMAQANCKTEMSAGAIHLCLAATTVICAVIGIVIVAKIAGL